MSCKLSSKSLVDCQVYSGLTFYRKLLHLFFMFIAVELGVGKNYSSVEHVEISSIFSKFTEIVLNSV